MRKARIHAKKVPVCKGDEGVKMGARAWPPLKNWSCVIGIVIWMKRAWYDNIRASQAVLVLSEIMESPGAELKIICMATEEYGWVATALAVCGIVWS
ncbi:unnamed protein product [Prunus armeniaca]|uniref:Uncharacterized protein n=1 Tax=Prunus armeniaca TaxID=36596 RepID=A0A6J5WBQ1_PRUAR|nr:unnamed protein product [Prunus armeniaca]